MPNDKKPKINNKENRINEKLIEIYGSEMSVTMIPIGFFISLILLLLTYTTKKDIFAVYGFIVFGILAVFVIYRHIIHSIKKHKKNKK